MSDKLVYLHSLYNIFFVHGQILQHPIILYAGDEGPDQTVQMHSLIMHSLILSFNARICISRIKFILIFSF